MQSLADSIENATKGLKDLNRSAKEGDKIFTGFLGTMVDIAAKTDGAGKAWTTFSRLTSGSPIWKLQNKARAYLSILAGFQSRALKAEKAQREQNRAAVESIIAVTAMEKEMKALNELYDAGVKHVKQYSDGQKIAMQSTDAYVQSIMDGEDELIAYGKAVTELGTNLDKQRIKVDKFTESRRAQIKFKESLKTSEGRAELSGEISKKNEAIEPETIKFFRSLVKRQKDPAKGSGRFQSIFDGIQDYTDYTKTKDKKEPGKLLILYGFIVSAGKKVLKFHRTRNEFLNKKRRKQRNKDLLDLIKTGRFHKIPELFRKTNKTVSYLGLIMKVLALRNLATSKYGIIFRKKVSKLMGGIQPLLSLAMKFFIYAILGMLIVVAAAKVLHDIVDFMQHFGIMDDINKFIQEAVSIIGKVFMVIGNLINGDFESLFGNLQSILDSLLSMAFVAGKILLKASIAILIGTFYSLIDMMSYLFFEGNFMEKVLPALMYLGGIYFGLAVAKYLLGIALHLIGMAALPIIMIALIAAFMLAFWQKIRGNGIAKAIFIVVALVIGIAAFLAGGWVIALGVGIGLLLIALGEKFKFFKKATGGTSHGGMTLVGEQGPELVNLPAGATVKTNNQTNRMMGGTTINNYITINAKDTSKPEMRRIANELSNMINMKINRSGSSRTMR